MAMQVGGDGGDETPISDINTTPLVDVMLVLLIIFLITVPVVLQTIPVTLPAVVYKATETKPQNVNISVRTEGNNPDGRCQVYMGTQEVSSEVLQTRAKEVLDQNPQTDETPDEDKLEVHIRADVDTPYRCIGSAIWAIQSVHDDQGRAGFPRVGFISQPPAGSGA